jgi:uncharacterized protein
MDAHLMGFIVLILISSLLQGISGFGFAVIAAPIGLMFFDQPTLIVSFTLISIVLNGFLSVQIKEKPDGNLLRTLILPAVIGVAAGVFTIHLIPMRLLKLVVGFMTVAFSFMIMFNKISIPKSNHFGKIIGLTVGFLQSTVGVNGPPLVLYLNGFNLSPKQVRKNLAVIFLILSTVTLPLLFINHQITWERLFIGGLSVPAVLLGSAMGNKLSHKIPVPAFKILTFILVAIAGIQLILNNLL